jgi:hypothetical protein
MGRCAGLNFKRQTLNEKLGKEGLAQSPEASQEKLLRRVTLDLTRLPPNGASPRCQGCVAPPAQVRTATGMSPLAPCAPPDRLGT